MSEMINNREQHTTEYSSERLEKLKQIFKDLQSGKNIDEVKARFDKEIGKVSIEEMSKLQHDFNENGEMTLEEVKRIYTLHTEILKGSVEEIELPTNPEDEPGHPVHTFKLENREIAKLLETRLHVHLIEFAKEDSEENVYKLLEDCNLLLDIDKHYSRKENLIFPYLETYGIMGPSTNMWRIDDFIRDAIKDARQKLMNYNGDKQAVIDIVNYCIREVSDMIYREENILFPMALMNFTEDEWVKIAHESDEVGFCLTEPAAEWKPERKAISEKAMSEGFIKLETGILSLKQLELMLNHLPVDITFIDQDDVVRYFSQGTERIFVRTKAVIGRTVQNCHPPRSVHVVEELLADFKAGKKDVEDFYIKFRDKYVYIRYFAVRDENGEYIGTLEFTQNIDPIRAINGEKRILS
ncbi:DUF438 domain-containing protein [Schinkia azotoformans]|uniref:DUF438 domain-containing protein n=1 Tax=Schinkia azotoformans TaxID=1454 RepID=UPI002DBA2FFC|nr:DUF438 domain-containing protein [Schinkia azotoformans]MEC1721259.1 DUF438 domain-containing protein [Schinkia azotoformans]MED4414406.1 DUF438 domain-containing protein [Schinkia azotoformans]